MYGADFDLADWAHLPVLDDADLPAEPPPEREYTGGITLGSDLAGVMFPDTAPTTTTSTSGWVSSSGISSASTVTGAVVTDLGRAVHAGLGAVHPGLVELARLGSADFGVLDAVGRVDALIAVDRQQAWLEARKHELLAAIEVKDRSDDHWCVEEVGAALGLSGGVARTRLAQAEQLVTRLPETLSALSAGVISGVKATAIIEASFGLADELLPVFEARVLARAGDQSITGLKRSITRAVIALDPATAEQKHQRSVDDRHVRIAPAENGMAWLIALLPAEAAQTIYDRLNGKAKMAAHNADNADNADSATAVTGNAHHADNDERRSMDQLRADTLIAAVLSGIDGDLPTEHGHRPAVSVIISLTTLTGQGNEPGWLDSYGPITAEHARRIAHDPTGTWRRLITDPVSGELLDYGTTRYRPPQHLIDHVIARDGECTFPFCTHTARRSDLDHVEPFPHGPTAAANLQPLHRRHHNAKTRAGWQAQRGDSGNTHWTSPQGRRYTTAPPERWAAAEPPPL